jgi:hypothetical protein
MPIVAVGVTLFIPRTSWSTVPVWMDRKELLVAAIETATFSAAIAMGAAEKKVNEKDLQFLMMVMMANLGRYWTFLSGWTKTEMVK